MWNGHTQSKEVMEVEGHSYPHIDKAAAIGFDELNQAIAPCVTHRSLVRDRLHDLSHRVRVGETISRVHEAQEIARRVGNALVHRVISSTVGLGLPVREAW